MKWGLAYLAKAKIYSPRASLYGFRLELAYGGTCLGLGRWREAEVNAFRRWPWPDLVMGECGNPWQFQLTLFMLHPTSNLFYYLLAPMTDSDTSYNQTLGCGLTKAIATQRQQFPLELPLCSLTLMATCAWLLRYLQAPILSTCVSLSGWLVTNGFLWSPLDLVFQTFTFPPFFHICVRSNSYNKCLISLILTMTLFSHLSLN